MIVQRIYPAYIEFYEAGYLLCIINDDGDLSKINGSRWKTNTFKHVANAFQKHFNKKKWKLP